MVRSLYISYKVSKKIILVCIFSGFNFFFNNLYQKTTLINFYVLKVLTRRLWLSMSLFTSVEPIRNARCQYRPTWYYALIIIIDNFILKLLTLAMDFSKFKLGKSFKIMHYFKGYCCMQFTCFQAVTGMMRKDDRVKHKSYIVFVLALSLYLKYLNLT